jgi:hypothetical protein
MAGQEFLLLISDTGEIRASENDSGVGGDRFDFSGKFVVELYSPGKGRKTSYLRKARS